MDFRVRNTDAVHCKRSEETGGANRSYERPDSMKDAFDIWMETQHAPLMGCTIEDYSEQALRFARLAFNAGRGSKPELNPCKFCGAIPTLIKQNERWYVACSCGIRQYYEFGDFGSETGRMRAIKDWNERAERAAKRNARPVS